MASIIDGREGSVAGKIAIVVSRYNDSITAKLLRGSQETFSKNGITEDRLIVVWVSGAWEIPLIADQLLFEREIVAVVALGAVIRGETTHDQHINRAVSQGLMQISIERGKPVGFGLLTVESLEQALQRAGGAVGNKGEEAALAVLDSLRILQRLTPAKAIGLQ